MMVVFNVPWVLRGSGGAGGRGQMSQE